MLRIENLCKSYDGKTQAVSGLSLHVESGDIFGFLGHNGAGKTTTIKCVTSLLPFESGSIAIDGLDIKENSMECRRRTAYLPDNPDLYDHLTGMQYLNFMGDVFRVGTDERKALISRYADAFGLSGALATRVGEYSHGMKQKLALIGALIHKPRLLVLDEPFVGLDPVAAHRVKEILAELCREGSAVFFSTHVLEVAEKLCNKLAIIKEGKIVICGKTADVVGDETLEDIFLELAGHDA
ncbi:MAG: ABC transporter ATP-binding protein [Christensenellaceae bacterium]|nr:ABC transporter ATP-binding protein [Christensenellaceae bacterium]